MQLVRHHLTFEDSSDEEYQTVGTDARAEKAEGSDASGSSSSESDEEDSSETNLARDPSVSDLDVRPGVVTCFVGLSSVLSTL